MDIGSGLFGSRLRSLQKDIGYIKRRLRLKTPTPVRRKRNVKEGNPSSSYVVHGGLKTLIPDQEAQIRLSLVAVPVP